MECMSLAIFFTTIFRVLLKNIISFTIIQLYGGMTALLTLPIKDGV